MYSKPFYITEAVWNNAFSFDKRLNKKLYIPALKEISSFDEIELQDDKEKIAFEDFWFDWILSTNYWLKNFYEITRPHPNPLLKREGIEQKIFLFDNHNHAFYFWCLARNNGLIWDRNILIHIDEHADTRDPLEYLFKPDSLDLEKVFEYTNFWKVNVWNYIIPAIKEWIIWEVLQIRNETNLQDYLEKCNPHPNPLPIKERGQEQQDIILNLDLDFFQPDLDFIDYELKKKVVLDAAKKAKLITVASSPFFIDQDLALRVFKNLFD